MALQKDGAKLLRRALKILNGVDNHWVSTKYISDQMDVSPAKVRGLLEWNINNIEDCYIEGRKSGRIVEWRSNQVTKLHDPEPLVNVPEVDVVFIDGLAEVLGNKEKYRQALLKIRQVIDDALGDVISH